MPHDDDDEYTDGDGDNDIDNHCPLGNAQKVQSEHSTYFKLNECIDMMMMTMMIMILRMVLNLKYISGFSGYFYTLHSDHECIISQQFVTFDEQSFKGEVVGQSGQETLQWGLWQCFAYYRLLSSVKPCKWSTNSTCSHHHHRHLITR